jgi:Lipopolysaccharide-assembly
MNQRFLIASLSLLPFLAGCAYTQNDSSSAYTWGSIHRKDVRTVAIPAFGTKAFSRGDELAVTQALIAQIESRTPYKVVPQDRADTVLEGMVVSVGRGTVSIDQFTALPQEALYTISVDFTWKDLRSGQILVERRNFEQSNTYYPTLGDGRFVGQQTTAEALAASIVDELQGDW